MAADSADLELKNREVFMTGSYSSTPVNLKNARVIEGMSMLTETKVEFVSSVVNLDLQDILGSQIVLHVTVEGGEERKFAGTCISCEYVGLYQGLGHYVAEVRPWLWFLTRNQENRIYQEKTVIEIIQSVLGDYGFSSDIENKCTATFKARTYCVQYAESDFDFISRLMEEEGIYYYFYTDTSGKLKMVLADSISAHKPVPDFPEIDFFFKEGQYRRDQDHIFDWSDQVGVTTGKVTLNDYDFESPRADQKKVKVIPKGDHAHKSYEHYRYPGHQRTPATAEEFAKIRMEALAVKHLTSRGVGNVRQMSVGYTFKLTGHQRTEINKEYLITRAVHHLQVDNDYEDEETSKPLFDTRIPVDKDNKDVHRIVFDVIPKSAPYRAEQSTPWPRMAGMQTALVTGPSGEEIYTDKYGRIKVQFYWDRLGKKDEKTTCWVRCVMPWTGKDWGMVSVPRIGQEVAIQFEDGDPDRPICTGMLFNADTMPPYGLPDNMTQTGIKTRSTKQGGTDNFNELVFEDLKDKEFVRMQSERDYKQIIKNNAEVTIGLEKQEDGDLTQTIHRNKTETLKTGNHKFVVAQGNQSVFVKVDDTKVVEGKSLTTIKDDTEMTVEEGDYKQVIDGGDVTREVNSGSESLTIASGDYMIAVDGGAITINAAQEISLTVGGNSITIDQAGVSIAGQTVEVAGKATVDVSSPTTTVAADAMLILDGGTTMIN